jgi:hypothetical protein
VRCYIAARAPQRANAPSQHRPNANFTARNPPPTPMDEMYRLAGACPAYNQSGPAAQIWVLCLMGNRENTQKRLPPPGCCVFSKSSPRVHAPPKIPPGICMLGQRAAGRLPAASSQSDSSRVASPRKNPKKRCRRRPAPQPPRPTPRPPHHHPPTTTPGCDYSLRSFMS